MEAIGILSILQAPATRIFLRVRTSFGCLEKAPQPTDGGCEKYTHKYSTYRVAQHDHNFITRTRVAQAQGLRIFVFLKQLSSTCHVSFLAAPATDYKHKFSVTHFIHFSYLSDDLTLTNKHCESQPIYTLRWSSAEWRSNTNPISHVFRRGAHDCSRRSARLVDVKPCQQKKKKRHFLCVLRKSELCCCGCGGWDSHFTVWTFFFFFEMVSSLNGTRDIPNATQRQQGVRVPIWPSKARSSRSMEIGQNSATQQGLPAGAQLQPHACFALAPETNCECSTLSVLARTLALSSHQQWMKGRVLDASAERL